MRWAIAPSLAVTSGRSRWAGGFLSRIELKADARIIDGLYSFVEQWVAGEDAARSARYGRPT